MTYHTMSERSYHGAASQTVLSQYYNVTFKEHFLLHKFYRYVFILLPNVSLTVFVIFFQGRILLNLPSIEVLAEAAASPNRRAAVLHVLETTIINWIKQIRVNHSLLYRQEGNVLFNDAHNTFYLRLYGVRHMVKDHSDSEKGNPLPPHGLLFPISSNFFYMHHPTDRITHTMTFVTPVVEHWLEREITVQGAWHPKSDFIFVLGCR